MGANLRYPRLTLYMQSTRRPKSVETLAHLPRQVLDATVLSIQRVDEYTYDELAGYYGIDIDIAPDYIQFLAQQRQHCTEICPTEFVGMCDDDLIFAYRSESGSVALSRATPASMLDMFDCIYHALCDGVPAVGISGRFGNNYVKEDYMECTRMSRMWFFSKPIFEKIGMRFDPFPNFSMEDFHLTLSFLENGYKNRVYYKYAQDDKGGSNAEGGCSLYRTEELMKKTSVWLMEAHPRAVTLVTKTSKTGWHGLEKRTDVRIDWQKAYRPPRQNRSFFKKKG